jgi:hypothetical protein
MAIRAERLQIFRFGIPLIAIHMVYIQLTWVLRDEPARRTSVALVLPILIPSSASVQLGVMLLAPSSIDGKPKRCSSIDPRLFHAPRFNACRRWPIMRYRSSWHKERPAAVTRRANSLSAAVGKICGHFGPAEKWQRQKRKSPALWPGSKRVCAHLSTDHSWSVWTVLVLAAELSGDHLSCALGGYGVQ